MLIQNENKDVINILYNCPPEDPYKIEQIRVLNRLCRGFNGVLGLLVIHSDYF